MTTQFHHEQVTLIDSAPVFKRARRPFGHGAPLGVID
jgi:hypothetical protein